jgi:predicted homoserine dehydrogenase-like protein
MTRDEKIIRNKVGVLELAKQLGSVSQACRLKQDIPKDGCIRRADVAIPEGRLIDRLRDEQGAVFGLKPAETALAAPQ